MSYVPVPVAMLALGKPLPVDVLAPDGRLLLRRGQAILSQHQKDMLSAHQACMTESDAKAWQRSYERMIRTMIRDGVAVDRIIEAGMPSQIGEVDYAAGAQVVGGWLDLQETLRGLMYQGAAAISPLPRLEGIESKALELLKKDADEGLFVLFQALAETALGYCATHALLSAVAVELTAQKLGWASEDRSVLFRSTLVMNIGMARVQDRLAKQNSPLDEFQKQLVLEHPQKSFEILQQIGVVDEDQLDLVRWHHELDESRGLARNLENRRLVRLADRFVARMAPRKTRRALSALDAARSALVGAEAGNEKLGSAMATAVGFYPPGTYVKLVNGEEAVATARGLRANTPQVVSIINADAMPLSKYVYRNTKEPQFAVRAPINAEKIKVKINLETVRKAMLGRTA